MTKRFDVAANPVLSSVIDNLKSSIQCSKYNQVANRIEVCLPGDAVFKSEKNKELAEKGFGTCLIRAYDFGGWDVSIIIDMKNCTQAYLTEREITAVVFHELGHILNEPELQPEPTFEFCFIHGLQFSHKILEEVRESNAMRMEIFADSYASKHGYGDELISTFHKQQNNFEQKIAYCSTRVEKILNREYFEGKTMSLKKRDLTSSGI